MSNGAKPGNSMKKITVVAAPVRQQIADAIRNAILTEDFKPGDRLIERELCALTGVSRTSLREGLRELESEGLITNQPNRGLVVTTLSYEDAEHIYEVLGRLIGLLGKKAAELRTIGDLLAFRGHIKSLEQAIDAGDHDTVVTLNAELYTRLIGVVANPVLSTSVVQLQNRLAQFRTALVDHPATAQQNVDAVREIVTCIAAQDGAKAEAACIAHVQLSCNVVLKKLRLQAG